MDYMKLLLMLASFPLIKGDRVIKTNNGLVRGKTVASGKVEAFLGIPYAQPPVGSLRFAKPVPKTWQNVHEATNMPPACIQAKMGNEFVTPNMTGMTEDCLYLNIWVPQSKTATELKTIMLWIHGGSFLTGSSNMKLYDGSKLSEYGDIIVVTINYRLGALGFFTGFIEDAPGNVGLHDQVMAIRWIKENANHFSGDPDNIVLFGESSGAFSVSMHQISPLSKNLFKRSILQSGSAIHPMYSDKNKQLSEACQLHAEFLGCTTDGVTLVKNPEHVLECLRKIPAEKFAESDLELLKQPKRLLARIGDDFLPEDVIEAYREGVYKDSEVLMGITKNEGTLLLALGRPDLFGEFGEKDISEAYNETTASSAIKMLFENNLEEAEAEDITRSYLSRVNSKTGFTYAEAVSEALGDYIVTCGLTFQAEVQSMEGNPVFFYMFDHRPSTSPFSEWMGVLHFDEIQYVFGNPMYGNFTKYEEELSRDVMNMWTTFAKTGNPNIPGTKAWPRYTYGDFKYFIIGKRDSVGVRPDNFRCEKWRNFFHLTSNDKISQKNLKEL